MIMRPNIISIDSKNIDDAKITAAARMINAGELVAFPTETVYGLGADALNSKACAKVFEAKKRPLDDPLIVHVADKDDLFKIAREIPEVVFKLIDEFWPGPLTLVLKKAETVPDIVTAGLDTVAVRIPNNEIALSLIRKAKTFIAAPSANLFGRPSPTTAQHVLQDLNGRIDLIVDGGKVSVGVESTILDLTQHPFRILRPGGISLEKLKTILPDVEIYKEHGVLSPGMYARHYSPKAAVILVEENGRAQIDKVRKLAHEFATQGYDFGIMAKEENKDNYGDHNVKVLGPEKNLTLCAANLFSVLREFDKNGVGLIIAEGVEEKELGMAIMDRLRKASGREECLVKF